MWYTKANPLVKLHTHLSKEARVTTGFWLLYHLSSLEDKGSVLEVSKQKQHCDRARMGNKFCSIIGAWSEKNYMNADKSDLQGTEGPNY